MLAWRAADHHVHLALLKHAIHCSAAPQKRTPSAVQLPNNPIQQHLQDTFETAT
jgi:hypothetical protein